MKENFINEVNIKKTNLQTKKPGQNGKFQCLFHKTSATYSEVYDETPVLHFTH